MWHDIQKYHIEMHSDRQIPYVTTICMSSLAKFVFLPSTPSSTSVFSMHRTVAPVLWWVAAKSLWDVPEMLDQSPQIPPHPQQKLKIDSGFIEILPENNKETSKKLQNVMIQVPVFSKQLQQRNAVIWNLGTETYISSVLLSLLLVLLPWALRIDSCRLHDAFFFRGKLHELSKKRGAHFIHQNLHMSWLKNMMPNPYVQQNLFS